MPREPLQGPGTPYATQPDYRKTPIVTSQFKVVPLNKGSIEVALYPSTPDLAIKNELMDFNLHPITAAAMFEAIFEISGLQPNNIALTVDGVPVDPKMALFLVFYFLFEHINTLIAFKLHKIN